MYVSKIFAAFAALITLLFNWFPNSDIISDIYYNIEGSEFGWVAVTDTIEEAVEKMDAKPLALMASKKLKENHPNLEQDIQKLFGLIEGDILSVENDSESEENMHIDYSLKVITTTDDYYITIFYTAVGPDDSVLGLRRIKISVFTDEYNSMWTDTENYISEGVIEETGDSVTRRWNCGNGNSSDDYVFIVNDNYSRLKGEPNVTVRASRNCDTPASGYAFNEEDTLKIHLIPEGEKPPAPGTEEADIIITKENRNAECYVDPGRYYLYVEPSDTDMYYSISVFTKL